MRRFYARLISITVLIISFVLLLETAILRQIDKKNAYRITQVLLDQTVNNIDTNRREALENYEAAKEDYKIRAQSVAYILDIEPNVESDIQELKKIANLLSIDEINLFDSNGTIYAGSVPEYFGLNMDSGEQISYFKPMLQNKALTMCQDVTPNTSQGKHMMYAITWDKAGTKMVQIGIEPRRLIEIKNRSELSAILKEMPVYSGVKYFVADAKTGIILANNPVDNTYSSLEDYGFSKDFDYSTIKDSEHITRVGYKNYYMYEKSGKRIIGIAYSVNTNIKNFFLTMHLIFIYLVIAALFVGNVLVRKMKSDNEKLAQFNILSSMSKIYYSMHLIDLQNNSVVEYSSRDFLKKISNDYDKADVMMEQIISHSVSPEYLNKMLEFSDIHTVKERLAGKKIISTEFISTANKWYRASFITIESDKNKTPKSVFFTIQNINEQKNKEEVLFYKSTTDELTGCYNRRAYEEDLKKLKLDSEFVYIEFDINGLKPINDLLGHEAGDEIIKSASKFMKQSTQGVGKVYRTGGDEFVALLNCNSKQMDKITAEFNTLVDGWAGDLVKAMSVSFGCVYSLEQKWGSILHIAKEADRRMYKSKSAYYSRSGYDRRSR